MRLLQRKIPTLASNGPPGFPLQTGSGARTADFICNDMRASQNEDRCLDPERAGPGYHVAQDVFALGG